MGWKEIHLKTPSFWISMLDFGGVPSLKMDDWKISFLLGWPIFRGYGSYVSFREGIEYCWWKKSETITVWMVVKPFVNNGRNYHINWCRISEAASTALEKKKSWVGWRYDWKNMDVMNVMPLSPLVWRGVVMCYFHCYFFWKHQKWLSVSTTHLRAEDLLKSGAMLALSN